VRRTPANPVRGHGPPRAAFSLLELVISLAVVAVLISILLPLLHHARSASLVTVCQSNLRQVGMGYQGYLQDFERFPADHADAEWGYGGAEFVGEQRVPVIAADRPINAYIAPGRAASTHADDVRTALVFRCPADRGVAAGTPLPGLPLTWNDADAHVPLFDRFGTSYLANPLLSDRARALALPSELGAAPEPVRTQEIAVSFSRLLVAGDPVWHAAARETTAPDDPALDDLSWHTDRASGNFLAADGAVRYTSFDGPDTPAYTVRPVPTPR